VNLSGPLELRLIARSSRGGQGRLQWKTRKQEQFPRSGQTVEYELPAGDAWQEITVKLPIQGAAGIVRLYLPAEETPVEVRSIRYTDQQGRAKTWNFNGVEP